MSAKVQSVEWAGAAAEAAVVVVEEVAAVHRRHPDHRPHRGVVGPEAAPKYLVEAAEWGMGKLACPQVAFYEHPALL